MKTLIVDSSHVVVQVLSALFARLGMDVLVAGSGSEALAALQREPVDLVCFDHQLGDMAGIEFLLSARADKLLHHQPALMLAAPLDHAMVAQALQAGVTECFSKHQMHTLEQFVEKFAHDHRQELQGRVLLIEDSKPLAYYYRHILERMGLSVEHCPSAEEAIERLAQESFDLVVTDYLLAGVESGLAVIRYLRGAAGQKAQTPILAISGFDDPARKVEILRNGANDFVAKPVLVEELEVRVGNLLTMHKLLRRQARQHETMRKMAMHDPLTELYNRHYLDQIAPGLIAEAQQNDQPLSLLVLDIDHFRRINDRLGHRSGDLVLQQVAGLLRNFCGDKELMARCDGEKFVALLPGIDRQEAAARAEALRALIAAAMPADNRITVSIGLATLLPSERYDALFRRAERAVYRAKAAGRNRVEAVREDVDE